MFWKYKRYQIILVSEEGKVERADTYKGYDNAKGIYEWWKNRFKNKSKYTIKLIIVDETCKLGEYKELLEEWSIK